jgi:hypothetical protein
MDLDLAIANLANPDPSVRSIAIEICQSFQTPLHFDWNTFLSLSSPLCSQQFRLYAFNSLSQVIRNHWNSLSPEQQSSIAEGFPFVNTEEFEEDPLSHTIIRCSASFLAVAYPIELIESVFNGFGIFPASLFSELVVVSSTMENERKRWMDVRDFLGRQGPDLTVRFILRPLVAMDVGAGLFWGLVRVLADVHEYSEEIVEGLLEQPDVEEMYCAFAGLLWRPDSDGAIILIMETALAVRRPLPQLCQALVASAMEMVPISFSVLFNETAIEDPGWFQLCLSSFLGRLSIVFDLLERGSGDILPIISLLLRSASPGLISETATCLSAFTLRQSQGQINEFGLETFNICLHLIATPLESLPGTPYDEHWSELVVRQSLFQLTAAIAKVCDRESLVRDLVRLIGECTSETTWFVSLVRVLSNIVTPPLNIPCEAQAVSRFLLSELSGFSKKTQNATCGLLTKLLDFLPTEAADLSSFARNVLDVFVRTRPVAWDSFTAYFVRFVERFSWAIEFPETVLSQIVPGDSCYLILSTIISRLTGSSTPLGNAALELQWLVTEFDPSDRDARARLNHTVSRSFELLASVQQPPDPPGLVELLELLIRGNNTLVSAVNSVDGDVVDFIKAFGALSRAIIRFVEFSPIAFLSFAATLQPPAVLHCATLWLKRFALPLLDVLEGCDTTAFARGVCAPFVGPLAEVAEEAAPETLTAAKDLAVAIALISRAIPAEEAVFSLQVCLRFDDFRVFRAVAQVAFGFGMAMVGRIWEKLVGKQDGVYTTELAGWLFRAWKDAGEDFDAFAGLPGVTTEMLEALRIKVRIAATDRTKQRRFRMLVGPEGCA